ncbi:MAG: flagellar biosynthesis protein FlhF [Pirellulales bacterium]
MDVRTYRAATLQEALQFVRAELGPDATVLQTREVPGHWWQWLRGQRDVEVTAASDVRVASRWTTPNARSQVAEMAAAGVVATAEGMGSVGVSAEGEPSDPASATTRRHVRPARDGSPRNLDLSAGAREAAARFRQRARVAVPRVSQEGRSLVEEMCAPTSAPANRSPGDRERSPGLPSLPGLPASLFQLYTDLIDAELGEELSRGLIDQVQRGLSGPDLADPVLLRASLLRCLEEQIPIAGPIQPRTGQRRVVALVGPTGVGKTTTIAKLAANFRLREQRRVGLVTVDTYRIAAVEQLRTYADIIDLPMEVVTSPQDMRQALQRMSDLDLVLLDTAGRSPRDAVQIQELQAILAESQADEVHLVLSCIASAAQLRQTAEKFARVGATALLLTKLDEAAALGQVFSLLNATRLPLSYVTHGQNVPDDIAVADRRQLARRLLAGCLE